MKTWKRYSEAKNITVAIELDGIPCFTSPDQLHSRTKQCIRTVVFESGSIRRTFSLNVYRGAESVEGGDGRMPTTYQVFRSQEDATNKFLAILSQYEADARWKRFLL